jgi:acetyl-CoA acetyltransferase
MNNQDIQFCIESISNEVTLMLMKEYGWDIREAMDKFLLSDTYRKLENPKTGLYFQSPAYVYEILTEEFVKKGTVSQ